MQQPTQQQIEAAKACFEFWIQDWLDEQLESVTTEEFVEFIVKAALNA